MLVSLLHLDLLQVSPPGGGGGGGGGGLGEAPPGGEEERRHSNKHSRHPGDRASGSPVLRPGSHSQGAESEHLARAAITLARPLLLPLLIDL